MKNDTQILMIEFQHYWHVGSGQGDGYHLDAICQRDEKGLPYLPGRQLKGLLRQAVNRAEEWKWFKDIVLPEGYFELHENLIFGSTSQNNQDAEDDKTNTNKKILKRHATQPGILQVDSAYLAKEEHKYLSHSDQAELRETLFSELFSTAINDDGTAKKYSLRGMQVTIPVTLYADLRLFITAVEPTLRKQQEAYLESGALWKVLEKSLTLLDSLGAYRTRGLGEAVVSLSTQKQTKE